MSKVEAWERGPDAPSRQGLLGDLSSSEVRWGQDNSTDVIPELTEEDRSGIKERMLAVDKLFAEQGQGKYKIEVMFGVNRTGASRHQPIPGVVQFFDSGGKTHGGGDTKLYMCPAKAFKQQGVTTCDAAVFHETKLPAPVSSDCEAPLTFSRNGYGLIYCDSCKQLWAAEQAIGEIAYRLPMQKWAEVIYKHFRMLEMNADVVVKFAYNDIRAATLLEQTRQMKGDKLTPVRQNRPIGIYRLSRILRDVNAGADLLKRFYAFVTV